MLTDVMGRRITYLRLSLTDRCDYRCNYCMGDKVRFLPRSEIMSMEECLTVARAFVDMGVSKVRLTGGEPLVRKGVAGLVAAIASLPAHPDVVMTTNGSQLAHHALALKVAGLSRINLSLDSLQARTFECITRVGRLDQVLAGLNAAQAAGFERIKLNTVVMRGVNDHEVADLVDFSVNRNLNISFIEEMPLGDVGRDRQLDFVSGDEVKASLEARFSLVPTTETTGGPARYYRVAGTGTRVGFITPRSHNFCDSCNRVRVGANGRLYPCLGEESGVDLLSAMRRTNATELTNAIRQGLQCKPPSHRFGEATTTTRIVRFMSATGG